MRLVREDGLEACSLHRISRELDVAVAGLYRYFPSKAALIAALELRVISEISGNLDRRRQALPPAQGDLGVDALARVIVTGQVYRSYAVDAPSRFILISQIMADPNVLLPDELGQTVVEGMMTLLARVAEPFHGAVSARALWDGASLVRAVLFWNAIRAVLQMKKLEVHSGLLDSRQLYESMVSTLLVGWGADPADVAAAWSLAESWSS